VKCYIGIISVRLRIILRALIYTNNHTIFSWASWWRHATKPSRRWQPPRVTSTTGLQLNHLVPLVAISQCNALGIAHSLSEMKRIDHKRVRGFSVSTIQGQHIPKVLNLSQGWAPPLFTAQRPNTTVAQNSVEMASDPSSGPRVRTMLHQGPEHGSLAHVLDGLKLSVGT
jgi:hypothetical protein